MTGVLCSVCGRNDCYASARNNENLIVNSYWCILNGAAGLDLRLNGDVLDADGNLWGHMDWETGVANPVVSA